MFKQKGAILYEFATTSQLDAILEITVGNLCDQEGCSAGATLKPTK